MESKDLRELFSKNGIRKVKLGGFDIDGVLRGKYISLDKFWGVLEDGMGFCDVIFGWDITDKLYDNGLLTGASTGYPDAKARVDPTTFRVLPNEPDTASLLLDFVQNDGTPHPACARSLLKQVLARAKAMGLKAKCAAEYEFFVFHETSTTLHHKGFRKMEPLSHGMFGYSWVREGQHAQFCHAVMDQMGKFDIPIEGLHTETGPGVYEVAIRYDDALRAADNAALFKTAMKTLASSMGISVTFMAKWNADLPGAGGHIHQSLWDTSGPAGSRNIFFDEADPHKLSAEARHFLAGQLALMPDFTAIVSPTINSYKRYVPGAWAPLTASWGIENRTTTLRAIPGGPSSTRIEFRQSAADMNPYLAMAASLAAGLHGIEHRLPVPPPVEGEASPSLPGLVSLPRTLKEANALLRSSEKARELLGAPFVEHYVRTRDWEVREYEKAVTDWELKRYFEAV